MDRPLGTISARDYARAAFISMVAVSRGKNATPFRTAIRAVGGAMCPRRLQPADPVL